jgi:hypothetical protein
MSLTDRARVRNEIFSVENSEGKRLLGRLRRRWECNINTELKKIVKVWSGFNWLKVGGHE